MNNKSQIEEEFDYEAIDRLDNEVNNDSVAAPYFKAFPQTLMDQDFEYIIVDKTNDSRASVGYNLILPDFQFKGQHSIDLKILQGDSQNGILNTPISAVNQAINMKMSIFEAWAKEENQDTLFGRVIYEGIKFDSNTALYFTSLRRKFTKQLIHRSDELLYPGQILAAEFVDEEANKLVIGKQFPFATADSMTEYETLTECLPEDAISIVVAAGPFTQQDSLQYAPLMKLINDIKSKSVSCDLLILLGPIVDESNTQLEDTDYDLIYTNVVQLLAEELPKVRSIIVNSTQEIGSVYPIPQPPLEIPFNVLKTLKTNNDPVQFVGNPAKLEIAGEVSIAIISADVFWELRKISRFKGPLKNLLDEFRLQRTYIPFCPTPFPVDFSKINEELNLVNNHQSLLKQENLELDQEEEYQKEQLNLLINSYMPNIFIAPSKQSAFVENVNNTIYINPTILCNEATYAHIILNTNTGLDPINTVRVEIKKIK